MCRRPLALAGVLVALVGVGAGIAAQERGDAPYPIFTLDHLGNTMQALGPNFGAAVASLREQDYATAKERLTRSREQLATTITFWRDHEREDAIGFLRQAVSKMDDLDAALSVDDVDGEAAGALVGEIGAACTACHDAYREQDPETKEFRLKPGSV